MRWLLLFFAVLLSGCSTLPESGSLENANEDDQYAYLKDFKFEADPGDGIVITVWLHGAVKNPGKYEMTAKKSLGRLIFGSGGYTWFTDEIIDILRTNPDGTKQTYRFNRRKDIKDSSPQLKDGDVIVVSTIPPPDYLNPSTTSSSNDEEQIEIIIEGAVAKPGRYTIPRSANLWGIFYQAGGLTPYANRRYAVSRKDNDGEVTTFWVNGRGRGRDIEHPSLQDGDFIYVPETL